MKRLGFVSMVALLLVGSGDRAHLRAEAAPRGLPLPEHVTAEDQSELRARMGRHGATMSELVRAVIVLDRPTVRVLAGRIADEDLIATLNRMAAERHRLMLPSDLFREQSTLSAAARALASAAIDGSDDRVLADRFAALTRTCVTCHSTYLHGRPEPWPTGRK